MAELWHATILLPESSMTWSADRRRAVLLHELGHVRRKDCRMQLVAQAACALYWFNPLVWMGASQLRSERERACDDEVLRSGAQASAYAAHLLDIARELRPTWQPSAALAMARPSDLEGRLLAVLAVGRPRMASRGSRLAVVTSVTLATILALGASAATTPAAVPETSVSEAVSYQPIEDDVPENAGRLAASRARSQAEAILRASANPEERQQAITTLAATGQSDTIGPLRRALKDPDRQVREKAALALAFISGRDVVPALLEALGDRDAQVREKAALGLGLRRDARVVEPLIAAMADPNGQVREKAAIALGATGDPRVREALVGALRDPDAQVREKAAAGLTLLGLTR
jgi:hypothetical protein